MKKFILFIFIFILILTPKAQAEEFQYIFNDTCIKELYDEAEKDINDDNINIIKDSRGIILRFKLENIDDNFRDLTPKTIENLSKIRDFLAKIKNLAIIEVHAEEIKNKKRAELKNWEISTVIANNAEQFMTKSASGIEISRIVSVGYGEFLPEKNTPYNGGKYLNRIDIIVLCNVSGE